MPRKTLIAALVALAAALTAAPAGAASTQCPPGVTDASYCATTNESGLTELTLPKLSFTFSYVTIRLTCTVEPECAGEIVLESHTVTISRKAHSSATSIYGSAKYSVKFGETAQIRVPLTAAGKAALERTGTLNATVAAVSKGVRSVIGQITVKGHKAKKKTKKKSKHSTRAKTKPGFTG